MVAPKKKITPKKKAAVKKTAVKKRTSFIKKKGGRTVGSKNSVKPKLKKKPNGKNATGNPDFKPTQQQRDMVAILTGCGFTQESLCQLIPSPLNKKDHISLPTLKTHFEEELKTGKSKSVAKVAARLYTEAVNPRGNIAATIFFLRTQGKWTTRVDLTDPNGKPLGTSFLEMLKDNLLESGDLDAEDFKDNDQD